MEIIYNNSTICKNFSCLEIGSLFSVVNVVNENPVYMKIETITEGNRCKYNAIRLKDGSLTFFYPLHRVIELEGKLTVKRKEN